MEIISTPLDQVFLIRPLVFSDQRGIFVKTFQGAKYSKCGMEMDIAEEFYSVSKKNVIRGMHFQIPPHDHAKLVFCLRGQVLDVVLDLRKNSSTFGQCYSVELSASNRLALYIPVGLAHGFASLEDDSLMVYKTTTIHSPDHDSGIRWDSIGFNWHLQNPIISARDAAFPSFKDYVTPF